MTPEEITAMAKEAGFPFNKYGLLQGDDDGEIDADAAFAIFAALVAAKEWESIAAHYAAQPHVEFFGAELAEEIRDRGTKEGA